MISIVSMHGCSNTLVGITVENIKIAYGIIEYNNSSIDYVRDTHMQSTASEIAYGCPVQ